MQHTPGPWRVGKYGSVVVSDHPIDTEWIYTGHNDPDYYGGYLIAESIFREDDARLIAAAPDLLEACEAALVGAKHESCKHRNIEESPDPTFHCCDWSAVVELLEKAISKAKGGD